MPTKLVVVRNDRSTYEVHVETDKPIANQAYPTGKYVSGQSLDLERLNTELEHHGCSQDAIQKVLRGIEADGSASVFV